jgi:hypothetical protein
VTILPKRRHRPPTKRRRRPTTLSREQAFKELERLCDYYGISAKTAPEAIFAVYLALQDGLIRIPAKLRPPKRRGPRPIWEGDVGLKLLIDVARERRAARPRKLSLAAAIRILQGREPQTLAGHPWSAPAWSGRPWGHYDARELEKRYYDARGYWTRVRTVPDSELFNLVRNLIS